MGSLPKVTSSDVCREGSSAASISFHLENQGTDKRRKIKPKAESIDIMQIHPENKDYKRSRIITFTHNTGNTAVRFIPNCFIIALYPEIKNAKFQEDAGEDASADEKRKWNGMTPFEKIMKTVPVLERDPTDVAEVNFVEVNKEVPDKYPRAFFFNPITGSAANLISEVEVLLDGQVVQVDRGGFLSVTNTLNRLFIPSDKRTEIVGHPYVLHNEQDKDMLGNDDFTKFVFKHPSYEYAINELNAVAETNGKQAVILQADLDGVFPLSRPKNLGLEAISRCHSGLNQHPLIPPHTEITIRMRLEDPLHVRIIDSGINDLNFFDTLDNQNGDKVPNSQSFPFDDINFEILDISLLLQKIRWDDEKISKQLRTGSVSYNFDQYIYRAHALPSSQTITITKEKIPAGTDLIYVAFMKSNQLFKDGRRQRSSDGSRFVFPPKMTHIHFRLNGNSILFENGLHITRNTAHSDTDAMLFYSYLLNRNLTTDSFESFFPVSPHLGYKNAFPLDLTPFQMDKPGDLTIECRFATGSPSDYYIVMFMPQSVTISKSSPTSIWETTATIS